VKAERPSRRATDQITLEVSYRDDRVVERRLYVNHSLRHNATFLSFECLLFSGLRLSLSHTISKQKEAESLDL
jgi:hypothetical protein